MISRDQHETVFLAVTLENGGLVISQFITKARSSKAEARLAKVAADIEALRRAGPGDQADWNGEKIPVAEAVRRLGVLSAELEATRYDIEPTPANLAAFIEKSSEVWSSKPASWRVIAREDLPADPARGSEDEAQLVLRDAWVDTGDGIVVDHKKAAGLILGKLRAKRAERFSELDGRWMSASARGDAELVDDVESKRQALRDLPAAIAPDLKSAKTPDDFRRLWQETVYPAVAA